jgi:hypothetical protein
MQLRLLNLQVVQQPKLLLMAQVASGKAAAELDLVWDSLVEALEAPPCPNCGRPGFVFELTRQGRLACPNCPPAPTGTKRP